MNAELRNELETAIRGDRPLEEIIALLRGYKARGASQEEVYSFLTELHEAATEEALEDRIAEVSDFVAGFCSPHMAVWKAP